MNGYLFSLEALIAIVILLFSIIIFNIPPMEVDNKKEYVYNALDLLEEENKLTGDKKDVANLNNILDFDVTISECDDAQIIDYLIVSGNKDFKIIRVCY